jgi:lysophospholipase L1-like esterase
MNGTLWSSTTLHDDPLFFVDRGEGPATATLLFPVTQLLTVRNAAGDVEYLQGRDFELDAPAGLVIRPARSRIPVTTRDELYARTDPGGSSFMFSRNDPGTYLMFSEGDLFHRRQLRTSYIHPAGQWRGRVPSLDEGALPRTLRLLKTRAPIAIAVAGDSISEGYNASGFLGVPPFQPPWVERVAAALTAAYGSPISIHNCASAGWTADQGLADVDRVGAPVPDLVIVAFGMNDSGYASAQDFGGNIAGIVAGVRGAAPHAEFVLVSPMLPNPEWHYPVMERFAEYRQALGALRGPGVAFADVTDIWTELLVRKSVYDLTGNGVNHPNDFGHRVYADVILAQLCDPTPGLKRPGLQM